MPSIPDEEWAEILQEVPSANEPFIQQYVGGREALIQQEKSMRSDHAFRKSLSPLGKKACEIVARIREEEQRTIWASGLEADLVGEEKLKHVFPGMMFGLAKGRMEKTRLWRIVRRMPKGALLHAHMDAMVDFDFLLDVLLATPGMHICCGANLSTAERRETESFIFRFKKSTVRESDIWSADYVGDTFVPVTKAADSFPGGGRPAFLLWLKSRLTISRDESLEHHHGVDAVWRKFQSIFVILGGLVAHEPIFRQFMQRMMSLCLADGVRWIDLRLAFTFRWYAKGQDEPSDGFAEFFQAFGEEIEKFKASEEGKGFWGARIIWSGLRALDTRGIIEDMDSCITMKVQFPHLVAGYDLVGQEDAGRPLKDALPELFWFRKECAANEVELPFFFHAGECLGDGNDTDQNLFDAILLGTRRIGHGFSLYKHPLLIEMVKQKMILIESCPISNEVLRLCASAMSHPLPALLARGVTCALCNDDPAILGQDTAGMTHDFWQALQAWDNLGLAGLGSLAENSIRYAAFEDQTSAEWLESIKEASLGNGIRAQRMQEWQIQWEHFCLWIVTEYGNGEDD